MPAFDASTAPLRRLVLTLPEADAVLFGREISRSHRAKLVKRGDFPVPFNIGGRLVVAVSDLESLVEAKRAGAPAELERRRQATAAAIEGRQRRRRERRERGEDDPGVAAMNATRAAADAVPG